MQGKVTLALAKLVVVMVLLALPWPSLRQGFAAAYCSLANVTFGELTFGSGGRLHMLALDSALGPKTADDFNYDSVLQLSAVGRDSLPFGMSLRKDLFLPLCVFLAVTFAAPTSYRQKLLACALGIPSLTLLWLGLIGITAVWGFSSMPGLLSLSQSSLTLIDTLVAVLLVPPGNRFVVPLLLSVWIAVRQRGDHAARSVA